MIPDSSSQDVQRLRHHSNHHQHHPPTTNLHPSASIYTNHPHHTKSQSISSILKQPHLDPPQYLPRRRPTLSHDSSSQALLALRATALQEHPSHHPNPITNQQKPRSSSVSINPTPSIGNLHHSNQLKLQRSSSSLRSKTPISNEPINTTQSLLSNLNLMTNRSFSALPTAQNPYYHPSQRHSKPPTSNHPSSFLPLNAQNNNISSIRTIKHSLIQSIHNLPCNLQDKLFFLAKLHAEVQAELTKLDMAPSNRTHTTNPSDNQKAQMSGTRQEIDDPIHLIQLSDRIKALALSQFKQDLYR